MNFLKTLLYLTACGLGSFMRREYIKGSLLVLGFWASLVTVAVGIQSEGFLPFVLVPSGTFAFFFVWIYNALETFDNKGLRRKKVKIEDEWQELYDQGVAAYLKKDYDQAAQKFRSIIQKNRHDADAYFQLGKIYFKNNEVKPAKKMLKKYLVFDVKGKWEQEANDYLKKLQKA